jgi:hypothetical protein
MWTYLLICLAIAAYLVIGTLLFSIVCYQAPHRPRFHNEKILYGIVVVLWPVIVIVMPALWMLGELVLCGSEFIDWLAVRFGGQPEYDPSIIMKAPDRAEPK